MKVRELIDLLKKLPNQEQEIWVMGAAPSEIGCQAYSLKPFIPMIAQKPTGERKGIAIIPDVFDYMQA